MDKTSSPVDAFKDLENDLRRAIQFDNTYQLQNAAKFRAVNQNVESYEEFKEMVNAAHLQPIKEVDKQAMRSFKPVIWNPLVNSQNVTNVGATKPGINEKFEVPLSPQNYQEFVKKWKSNLPMSEKFTMLRNVCAGWLARILEMEMSSCTLGHLLKVLLHFENSQSDYEFVVQMLNAISEASRFQLTLDFLSKGEIKDCTSLFQLLRARLEHYPDMEIKETLNHLENKYKFL